MKSLISIFAAALIAAGMASTAFAAGDQDRPALVPGTGVEQSGAVAVDDRIKLAGGDFGAGVVTGIIGSIIVDKLHRHHRYGHRRHYRRRHGSCRYWSRRCAHNWGYGGRNYRGCMRYHGCY